MKIGVLALQGDFALHTEALARCRSASRTASSGEVSGDMAEVETVECAEGERRARAPLGELIQAVDGEQPGLPPRRQGL